MARVTGFTPQQVDDLVEDMVEGYYRQISPHMTAAFRRNAPIDTGLLRASHSADPPRMRRGRRDWYIRFRAEVFYAIIQHEGHGGIKPVRAKALRWVTKAGAVVFARSVKPQPGRPWMYETFLQYGFRRVRRIRQP